MLLNIYKGNGKLNCASLLASWSEKEGPLIYYADSRLLLRLHGTLFCQGSGSQYAYHVLDARYCYDMTKLEDAHLAVLSIKYASDHDICTGGFAIVCHIGRYDVESVTYLIW